jgi:hypothetical protein
MTSILWRLLRPEAKALLAGKGCIFDQFLGNKKPRIGSLSL